MARRVSITPESRVVRASHVLSAELADEIVMADLDRGRYFGLNPTASWIWNQLGAPLKVSDLCNGLLESYRVDADTCRREVLNLLSEMRDQRLIDVCEPG